MDDFRETPSPETRAWERGYEAAWAAADLDLPSRMAAYAHAMANETPAYARDFDAGWYACVESRAEADRMKTESLLERRMYFHKICLGNAEAKVEKMRKSLVDPHYSAGQVAMRAIDLASAEADVQASKAVLAELDALLLNCKE